MNPRKTIVILGECKDRGRKGKDGNEGTINETDIAVVDALPSKHLDVFVLLAKLRPFTSREIELAKILNDDYRQRAILLTDRELEPWRIYERTEKEFKIESYACSAEHLARNTAAIYFADKPDAQTQ